MSQENLIAIDGEPTANLLAVTKETVDVLKKHAEGLTLRKSDGKSKSSTNIFSDLMALYMFYAYTAKWQNQYRMKCSTGFAAKGLGWSDSRVVRAKKVLKEVGLIEDLKVKGEDGKVSIHLIKFKYFVKASKSNVQIHPMSLSTPCHSPQGGEVHGVDNSGTNAYSNDSLNAYVNGKLNTSPYSPPEGDVSPPKKVKSCGVTMPHEKTELHKRVEKLKNMKETTPWDNTLTKAFHRALPILQATEEYDWRIMEEWYKQPQKEVYSRKNLTTALNNWTDDLTSARNWAKENNIFVRQSKQRTPEEMEAICETLGIDYSEGLDKACTTEN